MKAVFLDREGTIVMEPYDEVLDSPEKVYLFNETNQALSQLAGMDYAVFLVVNDNGLAQKRMTEDQFQNVNHKLMQLISPSGIKIEKVYYCPHAAADGCECRKPRPGMINQALEDYPEIDITESWVIGDRLHDVGLGKAAGTKTILVDRDSKYADGTADFIVPDLMTAVQQLEGPTTPGLSFS